MMRTIKYLLVLLIFSAPLIFSKSTTEVYGLVKVTAIELFGLILFILSLIQYIKRDNIIFRAPRTGFLVILFFIIACISLIKAVNIHAGFESLYLLTAYIIIFFVIQHNTETLSDVYLFIAPAILAGVIGCLFSIYTNKGLDLSTARFAYTSTFGNPIFFSQYLSAMVPLGLAIAIQKSAKKGLGHFLRIGFYLASVILMLVLLIYIRSLGAYLGLTIAFLYFFSGIFSMFSRKTKRILIGFSLGFVVLAVALAGIFWPRLQSNIKGRHLENLMRVYVWTSTLNIIKDKPLLGAGIGNFEYVYPLYRTKREREVTPKGVKYTKAHNEILQVWSEMGIFGLLAFLGIIFYAFKRSRHFINVKKKENSFNEVCLIAGITASLISLLIQSLFNPMLEIPTSGLIFWLFLGLLFAVVRQKAEKPLSFSMAKNKIITGSLCVMSVLIAPVTIIKPLISDYFLEKAQIDESTQNMERIFLDLKSSLKANPHNWNTLFLLGKTYQKISSYKEAIEYYEKASRYHPNYSIIWNNLGTVSLQNGDIEKAIEAFKHVVEIDDLYLGAYYNLAAAYRKKGQFKLAELEIEKINSINSVFLGNMYLESGIFDEANIEFHKALKRNPDNIEAYFKLAQSLQKQGKIDESVAMYEKTLKLQPMHLEACMALADLSNNKGELDKAISYYESALVAIPYEIGKLDKDILFYSDLEIYAQALGKYKEVDELKRVRLDINRKLALIYKSKGQTQKAINKFEELTTMAPKDISIQLELASLYEEAGRYEESKNIYSYITKQEPNQAVPFKEKIASLNRIIAHYALANIYEKQDMSEKAIAEYRQVLEFEPRSVYTWKQLGRIYNKLGQKTDAENTYKKIIEISPIDVETRLALGELFYQDNRLKEAEEEYLKIIELAPNDARGFFALGGLYRKEGRLDEAVAIYGKGASFSPKDVQLHLGLATLMEEKKQPDLAILEYKEVLKIEPANKDARIRLEALQE